MDLNACNDLDMITMNFIDYSKFGQLSYSVLQIGRYSFLWPTQLQAYNLRQSGIALGNLQKQEKNRKIDHHVILYMILIQKIQLESKFNHPQSISGGCANRSLQ